MKAVFRGIAVLFIVMPVLLLYALSRFGEPPPISVLWPREAGVVAKSEIVTVPKGFGVDVTVRDAAVRDGNAATEPLSGVHWGRLSRGESEAIVARLEPGTPLTLARGPDGKLFEVRLRMNDLPFIIGLALSFPLIFVGLVLWRAAR